MSTGENQFSLTRVASITGGAAKSKFLSVQFKPVPGFNAPTNCTVQVAANQATTVEARYMAVGIRPAFSYGTATGLSISGTIGSTYQIEYTENLTFPVVWKALATNRLAKQPAVLSLSPPASRAFNSLALV